NHRKLHLWVSTFTIVNLAFTSLQIMRYPYLFRDFGFLGQSGQSESYNPLIYTSAINVLLFLGWHYRFRKQINLKCNKLFYLIISIFLILILITLLNFKYEICRG